MIYQKAMQARPISLPFRRVLSHFQLPPLHEAAERGDPQAVARLLLDKSVDVNKKAGGHRAMRTALHRAAGYGHLAVVKLLLKVSFSFVN